MQPLYPVPHVFLAVSQPSPLHVSGRADWFRRAWPAGISIPRAGREKKGGLITTCKAADALWRAKQTTWMNWGWMGRVKRPSTLSKPEGIARQRYGARPVPALRDAGYHPSGRTSKMMKSFQVNVGMMGCNRFDTRQTATAGYGKALLACNVSSRLLGKHAMSIIDQHAQRSVPNTSGPSFSPPIRW